MAQLPVSIDVPCRSIPRNLITEEVFDGLTSNERIHKRMDNFELCSDIFSQQQDLTDQILTKYEKGDDSGVEDLREERRRLYNIHDAIRTGF